MNILVYDVAAENGGATSILEHFYQQHKQDRDNRYIYVLSTFHLNDTENITVINVPQVKKGWGNRLFFDWVGVKKYLRQYKIDEVLSLQNMGIPGFRGRQTVYVHNALPFAEYRYSVKESKLMWIYQNVIGKMMLSSIKSANQVIVQTQWMKDAIVKKIPKAKDKIHVQFPEVDIPHGLMFTRKEKCVFFYPANSAPFKNHGLILQACQLLKAAGITDYTVEFTLTGDETPAISALKEKAQQEMLPIQWLGVLPRQQVFEKYQSSVLVFTSYIETVGLPIFEAKSVGAPLLLADCAYAKNVVDGYADAHFFPHDNAAALKELMAQQLCLYAQEVKRSAREKEL